MSGRYAERMRRLSGRIFGDYTRPPVPKQIQKPRMHCRKERDAFQSYHYRNELVVQRLSALPMDLDPQRNHLYYPPHPQHYRLINTLRELGLFRDEHLDFKDEIRRQKTLRGKRVFGKYSKDYNK
ncbi:unnamed protein product [Medioppia subpectinata]|uniref:Small ribosomal subunit protein mS33 n=1 Tax=Medioppia subpectinata TaxID=1979941 RepID=A0A7R9LDK5_9ACAR|nr:unnamed protein product [Medioppia subpectinata]CAD7638771.1 unnamed protein product [Medioppia subpectinata]CAG2108217.1 unnamed protein product [Medioppia subpectinata]CAG2117576.1 unnamed protein product [Medioppia subpectinata]